MSKILIDFKVLEQGLRNIVASRCHLQPQRVKIQTKKKKLPSSFFVYLL